MSRTISQNYTYTRRYPVSDVTVARRIPFPIVEVEIGKGQESVKRCRMQREEEITLNSVDYRGYTIKEGTNIKGETSFCVYDKNGRQMFDMEYTLDDAKDQVDNYLG